jgi:hypothetical protein
MIEEGAGEKAGYAFRVVDADMPHPIVHWEESPRHIETTLTLEPELKDCRKVDVFANRYPDAPAQLSGSADSRIAPVQLGSTTAEMAYWDRIADKRCAVLVTLGIIGEDLFTGVSFTTQRGVIRRYRTVLQGDVAGKGSSIAMLPLAALFDVTKSPLYLFLGAVGGSAEGPTEPVTVIFDFPDGARKQVTLMHAETKTILREHYPNLLKVPMYPLKRVRAWTRAALTQLKLEFVEEAVGELTTDEWIPKSLEMTMVGGYWGKWVYRMDTSPDTSDDLTAWMGDTSSLRFMLDAER